MSNILLGANSSPFLAVYDEDTLVEGSTPAGYTGDAIRGLRFNAAKTLLAVVCMDSGWSGWGLQIYSWPGCVLQDSIQVSATSPVRQPVAWSNDESKIAFINASSVYIFDASDLSATPDIISPAETLSGAAWSADDSQIFTAFSAAPRGRLYDVSTLSASASQPATLPTSTVYSVTGDANYIVISSGGDRYISIYDATDPTTLLGSVNDGTSYAARVYDGNIYYFDSTDDLHVTTPAGSDTELNNTVSLSTATDIAVSADLIIVGGAGSGDDLAIFNHSGTLQSFSQPSTGSVYAVEVDSGGGVAYSLAADTPDADEGDTVGFTVSASGADDGTIVNAVLASGSEITADDIVGGLDSWTATISNEEATFNVVLSEDNYTEGTEKLIVELYDEAESELLATADSVDIADTSNTVGITWTVDVQGATPSGDNYVASEGDTVQFLVTPTTTLPETFYLDPDLVGLAVADYSDSSSEVPSLQRLIYEVTLTEDSTTEGQESFVVNFYSGGVGGNLEVASPTIYVADTSQAAPTYSATPSTTNVNEGGQVTITVDCTTVPVGTTLYWTPTSGSSIDDADIFDSPAYGSFEIDSGDILNSSGSFIITLREDLTTEGEESFAIEIRTGSLTGPVVDTTATITVNDTSLTPPTYAIEADKTSVGEGSSVVFDIIANWLVANTLYFTITGTASGSDFTTAISGSISMSETTYPEKTGQVTLTLDYDELIEGIESFSFQLRTGSTSGAIVETFGPISVLDEQYSVVPSKTRIREGETVNINFLATYSNPSATLYWVIVGNIQGADFTVTDLSGSISLSGGTALLQKTLVDDLTLEGIEYFRVELRRGSVSGDLLAVSTAILVEEATEDYDEWEDSLEGTRIVLVEMQHSAGWVYFSNYPYVSYPTDAIPNRPYDDILKDVIDIESRMDGDLVVGETSISHDGSNNNWIDYIWKGYQTKYYMGEPDWSRDDFRLVAIATNGGFDSIERGMMRWATLDAKADYDVPLQETLLSSGDPVPLSYGNPSNVPAVLTDSATHEYQVSEDYTTVTPRDNGVDVGSTDSPGTGKFTLSASPAGNVAADVTTSYTTAALIIGELCTRAGKTADSSTVGALPSYVLGMFYSSPVTIKTVLDDVCQSLAGFWTVGLDGELEAYLLDSPKATPDFEITADDVLVGGLRFIGADDPVKNLTVNYNRNFFPVSRDSIAGAVLSGDPDFADYLTKEWDKVTTSVSSAVAAKDLTINTYLTSQADAEAVRDRIASLRSVRQERWEVQAFVSFADAKIGNTVKITNPRHGFESGRSGVIVSVSRSLTRKSVFLEVMIPSEDPHP